jgi:hypothetical protein
LLSLKISRYCHGIKFHPLGKMIPKNRMFLCYLESDDIGVRFEYSHCIFFGLIYEYRPGVPVMANEIVVLSPEGFSVSGVNLQ